MNNICINILSNPEDIPKTVKDPSSTGDRKRSEESLHPTAGSESAKCATEPTIDSDEESDHEESRNEHLSMMKRASLPSSSAKLLKKLKIVIMFSLLYIRCFLIICSLSFFFIFV
jgi:hypothetical protein